MREFQEKHQFRRKLYSKTMLFILAIVIILIANGVMNVYAKEKLSRGELGRIQKEQDSIQRRYDSLQGNSEKIKTNDGVEAEIRSKFDVAKQGEGVIVIVNKEVPKPVEDNRGIFKKIWDSVMGVFKKKQ